MRAGGLSKVRNLTAGVEEGGCHVHPFFSHEEPVRRRPTVWDRVGIQP
jgi:hypothetical protein